MEIVIIERVGDDVKLVEEAADRVQAVARVRELERQGRRVFWLYKGSKAHAEYKDRL